jgi:hypothetical protein
MKLLILYTLLDLLSIAKCSKPVQTNSVEIKTIVAGHVDDHSRKVHGNWRDMALIFFIGFYGLIFVGCSIAYFIVIKRRRSRAQSPLSLSTTNALLQLLIQQLHGSNVIGTRSMDESRQQQEANSVRELLRLLIEELRNRSPVAPTVRSDERRHQHQQTTPSSNFRLEVLTTFSQLRG